MAMGLFQVLFLNEELADIQPLDHLIKGLKLNQVLEF